MGVKFKTYDDRQFCNGHRTVTEGLPFGYLVNGDYESEFNLKTIVEARAEVGHNFLAGVGYNKETMVKMIQKLELDYNRARQGSITQELTEIIAGAQAIS